MRANILCLRGPDRGATARALCLLRRRQVAVSSGESFLRVSPHLYHTLADVDRLLEALTDDDGRDAEGEPSPEPADPRRRIEELLG